jgi:hypothetical protein
MTKRLHRPATLVLGGACLSAATAALVGIAGAQSDQGTSAQNGSSAQAAGAQAAGKTIRLEEATMIIELNSTDRDAGIQVFLDGEPWKSMKIMRPGGRKLVKVKAKGRLKGFGLTELFSESNEPEFSELPLRKFKRRFPEGKYTFVGRTIEGHKLRGTAKFTHHIPKGPKITSPTEGAEVPADDVVASWDPVRDTRRVDIVGYRAIVEKEKPLRVFSADLPANVTSIPIPREFLQAGKKHKLEVQAIERGGNQTISEIEFRVE